MDDMDHVLASLFNDSAARTVLQEVARKRLVRFGDLLTGDEESPARREAAKASVQKLQNLNLINVASSGIEDFNTVFITSDGLEASRKISG